MARSHGSRVTAARLALPATLALALGGCGDARAPVPSALQPRAPRGWRTVTLRAERLALSVPRNWSSPGSSQPRPVLLAVSSGEGVIALSRYPRDVPAPAGATELALARDALVRSIRGRESAVTVTRASTLRVGGRPAIQLQLAERIGGRAREVLSTHVFLPRSEVVIEAYSPPADFPGLQATFLRVAASLRRLARTRA